MTTFYAVVYGSGWDDIEYFSGFHQACKKLIIQTLGSSTFHPMIVEFNHDPCGSGTYGMTKNMFGIGGSNLEEFARLDPVKVKENPMLAIHLINLIW